MSEHINHHRRRFLGTAATTIAAASLGAIRPARAQSSKTRQADVSPSKPGSHTSFGPTKQIDAGLLNIGYAKVGPSTSSMRKDGFDTINSVRANTKGRKESSSNY